MQTFLPYGSNFQKTASILDRQRLMKQRVETLQIMNVLAGLSKGWTRHPAVLMWQGYEYALMEYQEAICNETTSRGYEDTCLLKTKNVVDSIEVSSIELPLWLRDDRQENIIITHKGNLYRKDSEFYAQFEQEHDVYGDYVCHDECWYYWPTHVQSNDVP